MCNEWDKDIKESLESASNTINKEKMLYSFYLKDHNNNKLLKDIKKEKLNVTFNSIHEIGYIL